MVNCGQIVANLTAVHTTQVGARNHHITPNSTTEGEMEAIVGQGVVTVKARVVTSAQPVLPAVITPVTAPAGTVAVIWESLLIVNCGNPI